jgi:hypothetical protein
LSCIVRKSTPELIPAEREIVDFAKPVVVAAMTFATELTTEQVRKDAKLKGGGKIGDVNEENHAEVRGMMTARGIFPENEPIADDKRRSGATGKAASEARQAARK